MNIQKIIKKHPYKKVKAKIVKVLSSRSEEGYVTEYDKYDAEENLKFENRDVFSNRDYYDRYEIYEKVSEHANRNFGIVEEDFFGNPVSKVYRHWYNERLLIEYEDLQGNKHVGEVEISSKNGYSSGEYIDVFYRIDTPDEVTVEAYRANTIDDYILKQNLCYWTLLTLIVILALTISYLKFRT